MVFSSVATSFSSPSLLTALSFLSVSARFFGTAARLVNKNAVNQILKYNRARKIYPTLGSNQSIMGFGSEVNHDQSRIMIMINHATWVWVGFSQNICFLLTLFVMKMSAK